MCHLCSSVKIQAYLVPALSQFPLICSDGEGRFFILSVWLVAIRKYDQGFDPVYCFDMKHLCSVVPPNLK